MRLIDADALEPDTEWSEYHDGFISYSWLEINNAPTIEPKRGEWIAKTENCHSHWVCSKCGAWALLEYNEQMCLSNFCPNCGADMRERKESE